MDDLITGSILLVLAVILFPVFARARENARRSSCQSNLRQLHVALRQYAADYDGQLPVTECATSLKAYTKRSSTFRCPSKGSRTGASDYFFNARFLKKKLGDIPSPQTLVLMGDGNDGAPLTQLPSAWPTDEYSPAWRHMNGANYGFADGHVKWLEPGRVAPDLRMVNR